VWKKQYDSDGDLNGCVRGSRHNCAVMPLSGIGEINISSEGLNHNL